MHIDNSILMKVLASKLFGWPALLSLMFVHKQIMTTYNRHKKIFKISVAYDCWRGIFNITCGCIVWRMKKCWCLFFTLCLVSSYMYSLYQDLLLFPSNDSAWQLRITCLFSRLHLNMLLSDLFYT